MRKIVDGLDVELLIDSVTVAGDEATATISVLVDGTGFATRLPVRPRTQGRHVEGHEGRRLRAVVVGEPVPGRTRRLNVGRAEVWG